MLYRMRIYSAVPENLAAFHEFFRDYLLPVQLRHGARLVGRWQTEDSRVVGRRDVHVLNHHLSAVVEASARRSRGLSAAEQHNGEDSESGDQHDHDARATVPAPR